MTNYQNIINLLEKKDSSCLEELYEGYGKKFYSYCLHNWKLSEDEAWDIVYKTLETLVLKLGNYQFESKTHFDNFIFKVLINFLKQSFRSNRSHQEKDLFYLDFNGEDDISSSITKKLDQASFVEYYTTEKVESPTLLILNNALLKMEEEEKDILLLRAQNYSYDEIAEYLGIENRQLKVRHHRAKQKLIKFLNQIEIVKP